MDKHDQNTVLWLEDIINYVGYRVFMALLYAIFLYGMGRDWYFSLVIHSKWFIKLTDALLPVQTWSRESSLSDLFTPHIPFLC